MLIQKTKQYTSHRRIHAYHLIRLEFSILSFEFGFNKQKTSAWTNLSFRFIWVKSFRVCNGLASILLQYLYINTANKRISLTIESVDFLYPVNYWKLVFFNTRKSEFLIWYQAKCELSFHISYVDSNYEIIKIHLLNYRFN